MTERLVAALRRHTNDRGLVVVRESALLEELSTEPKALRQAVQELESQGVIRILTPLPFLILKWPGSGPTEEKSRGKTSRSSGSAYSFQSSLSSSKQLKESYGQPTSEEGALLKEILETLGEDDPTTFRGAIRNYSPEVIRLTLERIRRMPSIRKSRTALFRYLLPRINQEPRFKQ